MRQRQAQHGAQFDETVAETHHRIGKNAFDGSPDFCTSQTLSRLTTFRLKTILLNLKEGGCRLFVDLVGLFVGKAIIPINPLIFNFRIPKAVQRLLTKIPNVCFL